MGYRNALFFCPYLCTRNPDGRFNGTPEGCEFFLLTLLNHKDYDERNEDFRESGVRKDKDGE